MCGRLDVDGHHDNYDQPLAVRWLCRSHHRKFHAEEAESFKSEVELLAALRPLSETARSRVLAYVTERLATEAAPPNGSTAA